MLDDSGTEGGEHGQDSDSVLALVVDRWNRRPGSGGGRGQTPVDPADARPVCSRRGRIHRAFHHVAHTAEDKFVGYPETFIEPRLGTYLNEQFAVQVARPIRTALRCTTRFLPGTSSFSPVGASGYNIMATRMPGWAGPIMIERTPEGPGLRERGCTALVEDATTGRPAGSRDPRAPRTIHVPSVMD